MKDETSPTCSASPIPSVITSTRPNGENPVKFLTILWSIKFIPSADNRLFATTTLLVTGSTTCILNIVHTAEIITIAAARQQKRINGWGILFPTLSTQSRKPCFFAFTSAIIKPPLYKSVSIFSDAFSDIDMISYYISYFKKSNFFILKPYIKNLQFYSLNIYGDKNSAE